MVEPWGDLATCRSCGHGKQMAKHGWVRNSLSKDEPLCTASYVMLRDATRRGWAALEKPSSDG